MATKYIIFHLMPLRIKLKKQGRILYPVMIIPLTWKAKGMAKKIGKDIVFATELLVSASLALDEMLQIKIGEIRPDIIVADSVAYWGKLVAIKYGIPFVCSTTTFAFNKNSAKYMKHSFIDLLKMIISLPKIKKQMKRLQAKGYMVNNALDIVQNDNFTNTIVYTSKYFQPYADTFSNKYCFVGPAIRPIETPIEKTENKTVYISLGTIVNNPTFYEDCIEALGNTNYQVIIALGANELNSNNLPSNIQIYKRVDQMAALSIADVFISHCGMNSASEALYFEVPILLYPQNPEQGAVAIRTEELGAGLMLKSATKEDILKGVNELLSNTKYKNAAKEISTSFKNSGGAEKAREFLEVIGGVKER